MTDRPDDIGFDPHDPRFVTDGIPFDKLARIRAEQPVYRTPKGPWYLSRHKDVEAALTDVATFHADLGPITGIPAGVDAIPPDQHYLSEITEPRHKAVRRIFNATMTQARLRALEPVLQAACTRLVDGLFDAQARDGHADLHDGLALALPAIAMARLMGLGPDAAPEFMSWSGDGTLLQRPCTPGIGPGGPRSHPYFAAALADQRAGRVPENPLFRLFMDSEVEGRRLTDAEIVTQLHFLIQAGVHTTRSLLAHLGNRLVQDRALWDRLQADRARVGPFIEESLRHDSPVQRTTRRVSRPVEVNGTPFQAGDWVEMGIGSANRDAARYTAGDPEAFDIDRPNPRDHLAFGAGSHICPGAALARLEAALLVTTLLDRCAALDPLPGHGYPPLPGSLGHQPIPAILVAR